jgi:hypothetical protein
MDALFEQKLIQNQALSSEALWHAILAAHETTGRTAGATLPTSFIVLPLVFHRRTAHQLASRHLGGALYKAIAEDRALVIGLQDRMASLFRRTCDALRLGFHSGLFVTDPIDRFRLIPQRKTPPVEHDSDEVRVILSAAKRVGSALAELSVAQLSVHLGIKF